MNSPISIFYLAILALTLYGCSTPQPISSSSTPIVITKVNNSPEEIINLAFNTTDRFKKAKLLLQASNIYYQNKLFSQSSAALKEIITDDLSETEKAKLLNLNLALGIENNLDSHTLKAIQIFNNIALDKLNITSLQQIIPNLSKALAIHDSPFESAILLIEHSGVLNNIPTQTLNNEIWTTLRAIDATTLANLNYKGSDQDVIAWLDLAKSIQANQFSLEHQYNTFIKWKSKWPAHPASTTPPNELILLSQLPQTRPEQIIIALPFTGSVAEAGKAVRDGFMAAYLNNQITTKTTIRFVDTNKQTIDTIYDDTIAPNTLIIGPLIKSDVNKLRNIDLKNATTLALNYMDQPENIENKNQNLYQFGLDPETEVKQLASHLDKKQLNKIAFIAPETEHGFRMHDSLINSLKEYHGSVIESVFYTNQKSLSSSVAKLLGTDLSIQRKLKIQNISGLDLEFEPRRRNDIDAIFMLAKPLTASQLNPLFTYHYARDLPIFSSSQLHKVNETQSDLEKILFFEMPWMLSETIDIKNTISNTISSSTADYARFYALGVDAFSLAPRLKLLKEVQNTQLQGQTGTLFIDESGIVHRQLELATFKKGKAIALKD